MESAYKQVFDDFVANDFNYLSLCRDYYSFLNTDIQPDKLVYYSRLQKLFEDIIPYSEKDIITGHILIEDFLINKLLEDKI